VTRGYEIKLTVHIADDISTDEEMYASETYVKDVVEMRLEDALAGELVDDYIVTIDAVKTEVER
jgi:hypothetical protein